MAPPRKQVCLRGHDTNIVGRNINRQCNECATLDAKKAWKNMSKEDRMVHLKLANEWNRKNPEKQRQDKLKRRYGITIEQYDQMLKIQNSRCAVCGRTEEESYVAKHRKMFSVDHDHACCSTERTCGKCIRGLLCFRCNSLLGSARDSIEILKAAIGYIQLYHGK